MIEELKAQVKVVAEARVEQKELLQSRADALADWEKQNKELLDNVDDIGLIVTAQEVRLRELTLQAYAETGEKKPVFGVGIREVTRLEYAGIDAFRWAVKHQMALKLDTRAFERIVKADTPDFVEIITEPQATIATNLEEEE